jgi:thiamine-monophosphate kinase
VTGPALPLGPGGEFDRIRAIWGRLGRRAAGLGDDAALITLGGQRLALSCDLTLEERHFKLGWLEPEEIGWRAGAAALSDLAAVAAEPQGVLATVGVPAERSGDFLVRLMDGLADAAAAVGALVWGGDLVRSERVLVDVFVVGLADRPVERRGAKVGDGLYVTGRLGAPHAAVQAWLAGRKPAPALRERYARPVPRVAEARWLRDHGATAMIDVSDGLVGDAGHLAAASGVAIELDARLVPLHQTIPRSSAEVALIGGEEYELLVTLPDRADSADFADGSREFENRFGLPLTRIGTVRSGTGVTVLKDGRPFPVQGAFSHF